MTWKKKKLGDSGENIAVNYLEKNNYKILCRNYRCKFGEIDIIAKHKGTLCFVEVKTRTSEAYGSPQEAVRTKKQKKISRVALEFIQRYKLEDKDARFDVLAISFSFDGYKVGFIKNAFELAV